MSSEHWEDFKGRYDPRGAQIWIQAIEKIYIMMMFPDAYKVLFQTYMLAKEAEYWRENTRQRLEAVDTDITWEVFRIEYLKVYKEIN